MATDQAKEELSTCSICYGCLINPCRLPDCYHAFCENCLLTYITNIETHDKDLCEFHCPNCRSQIPLPESKKELQNWVKSLEVVIKDENMTSETSSEDTASALLCALCKDEQTSVLAEKYCIDCDESLCASCSRISHSLKLLHGHTIVDLQAVNERNIDKDETLHTLSEYLKCREHPSERVSVVCKDDDTLCCTDCVIKNHRHCETFETIEVLSTKTENESAVKETKGRVQYISSQIQDLVDFKKQNMSENIAEVKKKAEMLTDTLRDMRTKINSLFDVLEESIASRAKSVSKKCGMKVEEDNSKLKDISKTLTEYTAVIDHAVTVASDNQTYVILRKLAIKIEEAARTVTEACQNCGKYGIDLKIKPTLLNICKLETNDANHLAEVIENFDKTPMSCVPKKLQPFYRGIEEVAKRDILPPSQNDASYSGAVYTRGPRATRRMFLVSTNSNSIYFYSSTCFFCSVDFNYKATEYFDQKFLTGNPYGLTKLRQNVIAVGLPVEKKIVFLSENEETKLIEIVGHVNTKFQPKALCGLSSGDIALSYNEPVGFGVLNFKCSFYTINHKETIYFTKDKSGRSLKTFDFMAVDEKRAHVIQPCTQDEAVYCFDFGGKPKFKYTHEELVFPRGVGISGDGNIFLCGERSGIHVISPDGHGLQLIRKGCPKSPLAIAFDPSGLQFAVTENPSGFGARGQTIRFFRLTG